VGYRSDQTYMKTRSSATVVSPEQAVKLNRQVRERYALLVEKKYASSLSEVEVAEMTSLKEDLDRSEESFYEPIERRLESVLTKLRQQAKG
jgi:hypothetical protein